MPARTVGNYMSPICPTAPDPNYMRRYYMTGTKPKTSTPKDQRLSGRGAKPGPKAGSHNKPKAK